ncbi:MAG: aldo/keto reductase [Haliscomenobacter sp.]|nr:aldo/keto reductase [Haliscomenobacter sp.]
MNYKLLGKSGLRVSEICLGTMGFGKEWSWGSDYEGSKAVFDAYANGGGNFIDTANRYTEGTSEKWLGEFVAPERDHFVIATKYTLRDGTGDPNFAGNHRKNLMRSVEGSLKRLNTDFIDLLWVHAWDGLTPVEEVMRGLDDLVRQGKVHYIGISDTPAWVVSQANTMAELRGWTRFVALQIEFSLLQRTPERDLLPMAKAFELAITPWAPLAGGALTGKYLKGEAGRLPETSQRRAERANAIAREVMAVAEKIGASPAQVAIRWTMQKNPLVIPIVGATKAAQIEDCLGAANIRLSEEDMNRLETVSPLEIGFPHDFLLQSGVMDVLYGGADMHSKIRNHRE